MQVNVTLIYIWHLADTCLELPLVNYRSGKIDARLLQIRESGSAKMTRNPLLRTWKGSLECRADKFPTREEENLSFAATRCEGSIRKKTGSLDRSSRRTEFDGGLDGRAPCPANRRSEVRGGPYEGVEFGSLGRDVFAGLREMRNSSSGDGDAMRK